jgi:hypothetical protein
MRVKGECWGSIDKMKVMSIAPRTQIQAARNEWF